MMQDYPFILNQINSTKDDVIYTLTMLRDHMEDHIAALEIIDRLLYNHGLYLICIGVWLLIVTVLIIAVLCKPNQQRRETMNAAKCNEAKELGWEFEITVRVKGPGGEGNHVLIAAQENTNREYAEFIQRGIAMKYMELNEEFKNRNR